MNRFHSDDIPFIERLFFDDFWGGDKPSPEKIGFQRFGLQLREKDFDEGVYSHDFFIRDRNEDTKATSGFSVVKNNEKEFKVELDVWPFKRNEINVKLCSDKYFQIKGAHEEKLEDGSECTRKFERCYPLPRGTIPDTLKCNYCNGTLMITINKKADLCETQKRRIVPIEMVTSRVNKGMPNETQYSPEMPAEIQNMAISDTVVHNGDESVVESKDSSEEVPAIKEYLENHNVVVSEAVESLMKTLVSNGDFNSKPTMNALQLCKEVILANRDLKDSEAGNVTISNFIQNSDESVVESKDSSEEVPATEEYLENHKVVVSEAVESLMKALVINGDLQSKPATNALQLCKEVLLADKDSKDDGKAVQMAIKSLEKA